MSSKAERTTQYIIETIAPIFNKHGYVGTSMSQLTEATGLTKGALYGNFKNKEALVMSAYHYQERILLARIEQVLTEKENVLDKIENLLSFYKSYENFTESMGGCPIVNFGIDSKNNNAEIQNAVILTIKSLEKLIGKLLEEAVVEGKIRLPVPGQQFAKQMLTIVYGGVSMTTITGDGKYLKNTITYLDYLIKSELKPLKNP